MWGYLEVVWIHLSSVMFSDKKKDNREHLPGPVRVAPAEVPLKLIILGEQSARMQAVEKLERKCKELLPAVTIPRERLANLSPNQVTLIWE